MLTGIDLVHIKNLTAVKDNHVDRFFDPFGKFDQKRVCFGTEIEIAEETIAQFDELKTQMIILRFRILAHVVKIGQRCQKAMGGAFR